MKPVNHVERNKVPNKRSGALFAPKLIIVECIFRCVQNVFLVPFSSLHKTPFKFNVGRDKSSQWISHKCYCAVPAASFGLLSPRSHLSCYFLRSNLIDKAERQVFEISSTSGLAVKIPILNLIKSMLLFSINIKTKEGLCLRPYLCNLIGVNIPVNGIQFVGRRPVESNVNQDLHIRLLYQTSGPLLTHFNNAYSRPYYAYNERYHQQEKPHY
mmetsp:Transcript_15593/g.22982  ORF Transcript_15593/g.22982 Transcript_15593/m.22982 type:complete len:213 (-) Transcript_15593:35-673(-)